MVQWQCSVVRSVAVSARSLELGFRRGLLGFARGRLQCE
jgi:hypothetical protein